MARGSGRLEARGCGEREDGDARDRNWTDAATQYAERITNESNYINFCLIRRSIYFCISLAERRGS